MERDEKRFGKEPRQARLLADDEVAQASGGVGYSSIQCRKCGKFFADLDQYGKHIEAGCTGAPKR